MTTYRVTCGPTLDHPFVRVWDAEAKSATEAQERVCAENNLTWSHVHAGLVSTVDVAAQENIDCPPECGHGKTAEQGCHEGGCDFGPVALQIHTAGELHDAPKIGRVTFAYNLSDLLDDPAHKPDIDLVKRDGTDYRMQDFVFCTEGALALYEDMMRTISRQLERGKSVTVLILCRGGKHRSVAFGENLAAHFEVKATHHHKDLPIVRSSK